MVSLALEERSVGNDSEVINSVGENDAVSATIIEKSGRFRTNWANEGRSSLITLESVGGEVTNLIKAICRELFMGGSECVTIHLLLSSVTGDVRKISRADDAFENPAG
jgi:hypothetical protein